MGIVMKKMVLVAAMLAMTAGSSLAADMAVKAVRAPPPPPFEPWDFAFGSALMNDYIFRGITQSNHKPSVAAYFEPRYNLNKDLQLYIGVFAFDFGVWGYLYPGGQCFGSQGTTLQGNCAVFGNSIDFSQGAIGLPINGNFAKKSA